MLNSSSVIKNKWKIQAKIGQGAFGETYAGYDINTGEEVAVKVEKFDTKKMVLKLEVMALKKLQGCPHVVRYIHSGRQEDINFLIMERLGENIAELRKRSTNPNYRFSHFTTLKLGIQMLDAIEGCHNLGYIHRDIKPSNFVIGRVGAKKSRTYLIDFGLARKYRQGNGEIRAPRKSAGFRGTARYASVNSHQSKELGRRDDLWSVLYVLIEFWVGQLPWRKIKDKDQIGEIKAKHTNAELVKDMPHEFLLFMEHLQKLGYADAPDYAYLRSLLLQVFSREGFSMDQLFDWETRSGNADVELTRLTSPISSTNFETPNITAFSQPGSDFGSIANNRREDNPYHLSPDDIIKRDSVPDNSANLNSPMDNNINYNNNQPNDTKGNNNDEISVAIKTDQNKRPTNNKNICGRCTIS